MYVVTPQWVMSNEMTNTFSCQFYWITATLLLNKFRKKNLFLMEGAARARTRGEMRQLVKSTRQLMMNWRLPISSDSEENWTIVRELFTLMLTQYLEVEDDVESQHVNERNHAGKYSDLGRHEVPPLISTSSLNYKTQII